MAVLAGPVSWKMQLFDRDGVYLTDLTDATARSLQYNLNGIDQLTFSIPLTSAQARGIKMLSTSVKVWRTVSATGTSYADAAEVPAFAGVVGNLSASGASNQLQVTVFSAYWKLQFRFARATLKIPNLSLDANNNSYWEPRMNASNFLWRLIFHTNLLGSEQGGDGPGRTGIVGPTDAFWNGRFASIDPIPAEPWKYMRGTCLWDQIQTVLGARTGPTAPSLELVPAYTHLSDHKRLMFFNTTNHLGSLPNSPTAQLEYHTGANNCEDMQKTETADTNQFANYLVLQGKGDGDAYTVVYPKVDDTNGWNRINYYGIYQHWLQDSRWNSRSRMTALAHATLARKALPTATYQPTISPALGPWYGADFVLGDNVKCKADRGALQIPDPDLVGQGFEITSGAYAVRRIYTAQLDLDDFGFERATLTLAPDMSTSSTLF